MGRIRISRFRLAALAGLVLLAAGTTVALAGGDLSGPGSSSAEASRTAGLPGKAAVGAGEALIAPESKPTDAFAAPAPDVSGATTARDLPAAGGSGTTGPGSSFVPGADRVVRTAELRVEVAKGTFQGAFDRVASIAAAHGGFVASSSTFSSKVGGEAGDRSVRSGELVVRVPADRFDAARQALSGLGKVAGQSIRGEDVSGQLVDYEARLRSLTAQEEALRTLLGRAGSVGEVLQVQSSLFGVRQQIEQLSAQRADLDQRATTSTISVSLFEPGAGVVPEPGPQPATGLAGSWQRAVDGAAAVVGGMIVVVGWVSPLAVLGLLAGLGVRLARRTRRHGGSGLGTPGSALESPTGA